MNDITDDADEYTFDLECPALSPKDIGDLKVDTSCGHGYWSWRDGSEGGELKFERDDDGVLNLIDYDGSFALPQRVVDRLRTAGIIVDTAFDFDIT